MSGAPPSKFAVSLAYGQRADAAAATVLRRLLDVIASNRDGAIVGHDSEYLHHLRIAVRRSRTVQRQLASVFGPQELPGFRTEFRWLQQVTGEARDLDVYLIGFEDLRALLPDALRPDLEPVRQVLTHSRLSAHAEMSRAISSRRTGELLNDWRTLLESLVELPTDDRPGATRPIGELAGQRIGKAYRRVLRLGRAIDPSSPPHRYHDLRKKGKELRYLLELFGAELHPAEVVDPMIRSLKSLQDVLGRHQDREVQIALLRSLADEVATLPRGTKAVLAMGILIDRLQVDEAQARGEFADRFSAFAAKRQRRLVKATFG